MEKIQVLVWSERSEPATVYPNGINGAVAEGLNATDDVAAQVADIDMPGQGLDEKLLSKADVLMWWGHQKHGQVSDEAAARVVTHVKERGMGFIPIHSAHYSKPFKGLMGTDCGLGGWREDDKPERIHVVMPAHPIAEGIVDFIVPKTEMYSEPFAVPPPDVVVFEGRFEGGEYFRSGCCWMVGNGRVFYFRPGHETLPIMFQDEVKKILHNAVRWVAKRT